MNICICGGGGLGHVCAGVFASQDDINVSILTGKPELWTHDITVRACDGKVFSSHLDFISDDPSVVVPSADIVFLCLPGYMIEQTLRNVRPYLRHGAVVGSIVASTGFFLQAHKLLPDNIGLFGFQRTPFIARVDKYGHSANLLGYKPIVHTALENIDDQEAFKVQLERLFLTPVSLLDSFYEATLTNSNPILHTGRLYSMWHNWNGESYDSNILFYKEWNDAASEVVLMMDEEFMSLIRKLNLSPGAVPSLTDYYEVDGVSSLTRKIASIPAFATIKSPMTFRDGKWYPDFASRYFTEDFPYGLSFIKLLAEQNGIHTPTIDKVLAWGMTKASEYRPLVEESK